MFAERGFAARLYLSARSKHPEAERRVRGRRNFPLRLDLQGGTGFDGAGEGDEVFHGKLLRAGIQEG